MATGIYRRSSLFTGLVLVLVGVLLLVHNLLPGVLHLDRLLRYWPVLLILWGLARLLDWTAARRSGQVPPRLIAGSEIFLVIVVLLGLALLGLYGRVRERHPEWDFELHLFERSFEFPITLRQSEVPAGTHLEVQVPRGDITVYGETAPGLEAVATRVVRAPTRDAAQRQASQTVVALTAVPGGLRLSPEGPVPAHEAINLDVHVPRQISLDATTGRGDVRINGLAGPVHATARGSVEIENAGGDVAVQLTRGNARLGSIQGSVVVEGSGDQIEARDVEGTTTIRGEFFGPVRLRHLTGAIRFESARTHLTLSTLPGQLVLDSGNLELSDSPGDLWLETRNKDIRVEKVSGSIHITNRYGEILIRFERPPQHSVTVENDSGGIELILPEHSGGALEVVARNGDVLNEFTAPRPTRQGSDTYLSGRLGSGGPRLVLSTSYGNIRIRRLASRTQAGSEP